MKGKLKIVLIVKALGLSAILCSMMGMSQASEGVGIMKCSSKDAKRNLHVEFNGDFTVAKIFEGDVLKSELICEKSPSTQASEVGQAVTVQCHEPNKMDAGYKVMLFQSSDKGVYQAELSEVSFAGPRLLDLLTCG